MNTKMITITGLALVLGLAGGAGLMSLMGNSSGDMTGPDEPQILYWVAPMDPDFRRDGPGQSPMGMDLIPVYEEAGSEGDDADSLRISPAVENNIGVRTDQARLQHIHQTLNTVGYVRPVDPLTSVVDVRTEGWIEDLPVSAVGDVVEVGDLLFRMYSPAIATAEAEFLQATRIGRESLSQAARSRLVALGVSQSQINQIARRGQPSNLVDVYARQGGVVTALAVREGAYVRPGGHVMTITDLETVWVVADVFETSARQVVVGDDVVMQSSSYPGRDWMGEVEYVYPIVDPQTRTVPVRMRFENADGALRPDMYVNVEIATQPRHGVLVVPREAVIRTGQSERVILAEGEGRFRPAQIVTGQETAEFVEILSGLEEGEQIVVSGQFLIDSEASLRGVMLRMSEPGEVEDTHSQMAPTDVSGTGVVESLMVGHGMIDITHEPIAALDWPAMTMSFLTLEGVDLSHVSVGETVSFTLALNDAGQWRIASIQTADTDNIGDRP